MEAMEITKLPSFKDGDDDEYEIDYREITLNEVDNGWILAYDGRKKVYSNKELLLKKLKELL